MASFLSIWIWNFLCCQEHWHSIIIMKYFCHIKLHSRHEALIMEIKNNPSPYTCSPFHMSLCQSCFVCVNVSIVWKKPVKRLKITKSNWPSSLFEDPILFFSEDNIHFEENPFPVQFRQICLIFLVALTIDNQNSDIWYGVKPVIPKIDNSNNIPQCWTTKWNYSKNHKHFKLKLTIKSFVKNVYIVFISCNFLWCLIDL